jgi:glycosyltransferase involved in cell wall biosynthesis
LGLDAAKSNIIPNGMTLEKFGPARLRLQERRAQAAGSGEQPAWRLAYCARLVPIKELIDLVASVSELVQAGVGNFTLDVMGHAEEIPHYAAECYRRASDLGLDDYICFRGNLNMAEVLGDYDMLILPSYNEGQPLVVMEAMAVGLPIIGTPVGGMEQLILSSLDDGTEPAVGPCGLLVRPGDVSGLAAAMRKLMNDAPLYSFFAENSRSRVAQFFALDKAMTAYRGIYTQLEDSLTVTPPLVPPQRPPERARPLLLRALDRAAAGSVARVNQLSTVDQAGSAIRSATKEKR